MGLQPIGMNFPISSSKVAEAKPSLGDKFAEILAEQVNETNRLQSESADLSKKAALGTAGVSLHEAQIAGARSDLQLRFVVEVRNRGVELYKELMNMPV